MSGSVTERKRLFAPALACALVGLVCYFYAMEIAGNDEAYATFLRICSGFVAAIGGWLLPHGKL